MKSKTIYYEEGTNRAVEIEIDTEKDDTEKFVKWIKKTKEAMQ